MIELSYQQAAARDPTLEAWLEKLADEQVAAPAFSPKEAVARIREIQARTKFDPEGWTIRDTSITGAARMAAFVVDALWPAPGASRMREPATPKRFLTPWSGSFAAVALRLWLYEIHNTTISPCAKACR